MRRRKRRRGRKGRRRKIRRRRKMGRKRRKLMYLASQGSRNRQPDGQDQTRSGPHAHRGSGHRGTAAHTDGLWWAGRVK